MNYKKRDFLITNSIIILFVILLSMLLNYFLVSFFGFQKETFVVITVGVMLFGLGLYYMLSKSIFEPLFQSDENLQKAVKETLHELNIPISTIQINTQMLEKNMTSSKELKRLERIKMASNELLKLYENMEYQIKKEIDKVDLTTFDMQEIIQKSLEKCEDFTKEIKIDVEMENCLIKTDMKGFQKVVDNLISNALKYNFPQNGFIRITLHQELLTIFNTGKPIDTQNLLILFDQYFQEDSSKEGFGLGLFMVKEFCDRYKIAIQIESNEQGNKFILNVRNVCV